MGERTLYFLFTDTGTNLSRAINLFTRASLNHVSISFDKELSQVYSFGRKSPRNPFIGGFVKEEVHGEFLRNSTCAIYEIEATEEQCALILENIRVIEERKDDYRYNFIGLLGVLFRIEIERKRAFFCSQFVATVLEGTHLLALPKPHCFVTPSDIRSQPQLQLIYEGILKDYDSLGRTGLKDLVVEPESLVKPSFMLSISAKLKEFVIR